MGKRSVAEGWVDQRLRMWLHLAYRRLSKPQGMRLEEDGVCLRTLHPFPNTFPYSHFPCLLLRTLKYPLQPTGDLFPWILWAIPLKDWVEEGDIVTPRLYTVAYSEISELWTCDLPLIEGQSYGTVTYTSGFWSQHQTDVSELGYAVGHSANVQREPGERFDVGKPYSFQNRKRCVLSEPTVGNSVSPCYCTITSYSAKEDFLLYLKDIITTRWVMLN